MGLDMGRKIDVLKHPLNCQLLCSTQTFLKDCHEDLKQLVLFKYSVSIFTIYDSIIKYRC